MDCTSSGSTTVDLPANTPQSSTSMILIAEGSSQYYSAAMFTINSTFLPPKGATGNHTFGFITIGAVVGIVAGALMAMAGYIGWKNRTNRRPLSVEGKGVIRKAAKIVKVPEPGVEHKGLT